MTDSDSYQDAEVKRYSSPRDDISFFLSADRQSLLDQLVHLVEFGEGLAVIEGSAGAGKSALLHELYSRLSGLEYSALISLTGETRLAPALTEILRSLSIVPKDGVGELLAQMRHFAQQLVQEQMRAVLLVDNAHFLDDGALGAVLSLFQGAEEPGFGLSIVFSSLPGFVDRIDALQLIDIPVYDFETPLFRKSELADFIQHTTAPDGPIPLPEWIDQLWQRSAGHPGQALLALETMAKGSEDVAPPLAERVKRSAVPIGHVIAMALLLAVLLWVVFFRGEEAAAPASVPLAGTSPAPYSVTAVPELSASSTPVEPDGAISASTVVEEPDSQLPPPSHSEQVSPPVLTPTSMPVAEGGSFAPRVPSIAPTQGAALADTPNADFPSNSEMDLSRDERYLLSQADTFFTLQVLVASKKASLETYIARQPNKSELFLYEANRKGKRLYVVLAGIYPSKEAALLARNSLPEEQKKAGPWPRPISDVKREISGNT